MKEDTTIGQKTTKYILKKKERKKYFAGDAFPRLFITQNMEIIMRAWQTFLAPYTSHVWKEVNKWTQLFDATVIFIHMDLSAASESIVLTHLNHCQLLLSVIRMVLLLLGEKRKFRLVCEDMV